MRSLRFRAVASLHPSQRASAHHDTASSTHCAWRCLSTATENSQENAAKGCTPPPLEQAFASPLPGPVAAHSVLRSPVDSAILCSRLSQRQMRQRQRKWGALWRYRWESHSPRAVPTPLLVTSASISGSPRTSVCALRTDVSEDTDAKTVSSDAERGALVSTSSPSHSRSLSMPPAECEAKEGTRPSAHRGTAGAATVDSVALSSTRNAAAGASSVEDPLLSFLDSHEEDAALLLAMWTSLHRSCVFGSALSESLALQVRYFLHSLLRHRAIAAAVNFYYRLMGIGVQLRDSDLLLLFSSLTYESAASTEEAQLRKAAETAAMENDRKMWTQRRRQFRESAARTRTGDAPGQNLRTRGGEGRDKVCAGQMGVMNAVAERTGAPAFCEEGPTRVNATATESVQDTASHTRIARATHIAEGGSVAVSSASRWDRGEACDDVHPPRSIARRVAFHQQPEWVKRWILYEASMGTLDDLDEVEDASPPSTPSTSSSADALFSASDVQADTAAQSEQAMRGMEVATIVEHLHLLTLGAMQRDHLSATEASIPQPSPRRPQRCTSKLSRSRSAEQAYWTEALDLVRSAYAAAPRHMALSECDGTSSPRPAEGLLLPTGVVFALQSMLREVQSWEGTLSLLRLSAPEAKHRDAAPPRALAMSPDCFLRGAVLFMALAAPAQPWKTQAKVEAWMHRVMLPRLARDARAPTQAASTVTAATAALHALWLSHLCSVKASRPDEFVALSDEAAAYLTSPSVQRAIHGDLALMMEEVCVNAERAVDALHQTVQRAVQHCRASEVLAKSIRSGAYRVENGKGKHELSRDPESDHMTDPLSMTSVAAPATVVDEMRCSLFSEYATKSPLSPSALPSSDLADTFALCCAAVKETVWLRFTTAASTSPAAVAVEVLQFVEQSVHGPTGLLNTFQLLYGSPASRMARNGKGATLTPTVNTPAAPECAYVSCVLAITLLQLVQLLCAPPGQQQRRFGCQVWSGAELVLLVELAAKVLEGIAAAQVQQAPWRWAVEKRLKELATVTARTVRLVVRHLDIHRMNEKVMFGAVADQDVELFALLARMLNTSSELMVASRGSDASRASSHSPVWRILTATCSPRVLQGVHLCFRSSSALGKRVRYRLCRRDADSLDHWIPPPRSHQRTSARLRGARGATLSSSKGSMKAIAASGASAGGRDTGRDFPLMLSLRESVYKIMSRERTSAGVGQALQRLAASTANWKASLLLCELVTKDVSLARGTCTVDFFATTLDRMAQDVARSSAAARAEARASRLQGGGLVPSRKSCRTLAAPRALGPPNLWLSAIDVFWSAVDHVGRVEAAAEQHSDSSALATSARTPPSKPVSVDAQERAVLARLLLPLLRFSRAVQKLEVGRQWRRTWAAMYAMQEKKDPQWRRLNIEALSVLGDAAALTHCVADYHICGSEALLCSVAVRHGDWHAALQTVLQTSGAVEERHATVTTYSLVVARTILTLLTKSPMNLSNTAMRLRTVQRETWDEECSLAVVRLLLRGRRWRLAITHVDEALGLPDMQRVRALVLVNPAGRLGQGASSTAPTAATLVRYAQLLTAALQATAIGGDSERAPVYYDAFKALVRYVFGEVVDMDTLHTAEDTSQSGNDALDAALDMTHFTERDEKHASGSEDQVHEAVRELAPRARILFFRAMTKKMLGTHAGRG
ncbi:conserved hypothetical protein [Leishmania major strain Friedlin]|uniref:Uncharacterized protein n=1 Tax=Leishmania major TaxID=5664 RepID=Q4Q1X3_LEIMA|nr:conserved hypothetical protein [Leishmania major strain Friedlin]CAG9583621.1 hypothetical_protein_-_conserved [Leishmania major strain Friedlin]CAJ09056.1 conserved hypothetical protein [Leishmania major strain Friedlin]|eukprot:XP_001686675.1 conserved hypothetical protein [Leishmania major strain Friedlin]